MKQTVVLSIVLGVLLLVSVVQAVQLNKLKADISENKISIAEGGSSGRITPTTSSGGGSGSLPKSLDNLPSMVGGC